MLDCAIRPFPVPPFLKRTDQSADEIKIRKHDHSSGHPVTLTPNSSFPQVPEPQRILKGLVMLLLGIVMLCGKGFVVEASADQGHDNGLRSWDRSHQGHGSNSSSIKTGEGVSDQEILDVQTRQVGDRVDGDGEVENVAADPLYKPRIVHRHAVLTSAKSFLSGNPQSFSDLYFDENRSLMRDSESGTLEEVAQFLLDDPESMLFVDAYCDERGAAAYSLILGDRHAHQVQTYFMHLGLPSDRISPLSYGEEKIWCHERNAQCWEANLLLKRIFRLMAPNDPLNGCLVRLALTAGSPRFSSSSQIRRNSPLQRLSLAHSP